MPEILLARQEGAPPSAVVQRAAVFSSCRTYRYELTREWGGGAWCTFVGLNPSTADETTDDATIRRCVGFARSWGYARLRMLNLFAFRATDPDDMKAAADPIGEDNDYWLQVGSADSALTVAAWGNDGAYLGRGTDVRRMLVNPHYLRLTKAGQPNHPLYLPAALTPKAW